MRGNLGIGVRNNIFSFQFFTIHAQACFESHVVLKTLAFKREELSIIC